MHEPQIIPPKTPIKKEWKEYVILIVGIIIIIIGFFMLLEIAVGLALLLLGFYAVNRYLEKKRHK